MKKTLLLFLFLCSIAEQSQEYFPTNSGIKTTANTSVAFTNATIYVTPNQIIKKGTLLVKDGKVVSRRCKNNRIIFSNNFFHQR